MSTLVINLFISLRTYFIYLHSFIITVITYYHCYYYYNYYIYIYISLTDHCAGWYTCSSILGFKQLLGSLVTSPADRPPNPDLTYAEQKLGAISLQHISLVQTR